MTTCKRIIFFQGGKGGIGKTEAALSLISWYQQQGVSPALLDFDIENTNKSGLQNFFPEARKFDVHAEGALDEFFDVCDDPDIEVVLADLGAGAGAATYAWFDEAFEDAADLSICFTSIGVTTNEAGAVQSVLKWASHLQDRVDYLIILNEFREPHSKFEYWHDEPAVARFTKAFSPHFMTMGARISELQAELRNQSTTLQKVIDREVETEFLLRTKNLMRAKRYQRQMFAGFDEAKEILLPSGE